MDNQDLVDLVVNRLEENLCDEINYIFVFYYIFYKIYFLFIGPTRKSWTSCC